MGAQRARATALSSLMFGAYRDRTALHLAGRRCGRNSSAPHPRLEDGDAREARVEVDPILLDVQPTVARVFRSHALNLAPGRTNSDVVRR
jgi:hypothetical protein